MAKYRKLGRNSSQRKALLRSQVTALIENGKIVTTEARAKEVRKMAEKLITLAVKEKDNYETVTVSAKVPKKDSEGKRVKEVVDGKKVTVYDTVEKEIKKDLPSRLHARKQMDKVLYKVTEVPTAAAGRKKSTKTVDLTNKLYGGTHYDNIPVTSHRNHPQQRRGHVYNPQPGIHPGSAGLRRLQPPTGTLVVQRL